MIEGATDKQISSWYLSMDRILKIANEPYPMNQAFTPAPLRGDIQECVDKGYIDAVRVEKSGNFRLNVTAQGQIVYDTLHAQLVATGQVEPRGRLNCLSRAQTHSTTCKLTGK